MIEAKIDFAGSGDTTIITGIGGVVVKVMKLLIVVNAATNITFKDGATTLAGVINLNTGASITMIFDTTPWFTLASGNSFIVNSSNAVQVSGRVYYTPA